MVPQTFLLQWRNWTHFKYRNSISLIVQDSGVHYFNKLIGKKKFKYQNVSNLTVYEIQCNKKRQRLIVLQYRSMKKSSIKIGKNIFWASVLRGRPTSAASGAQHKATPQQYDASIEVKYVQCCSSASSSSNSSPLVTSPSARQGHRINSYSDVVWSRQNSLHNPIT